MMLGILKGRDVEVFPAGGTIASYSQYAIILTARSRKEHNLRSSRCLGVVFELFFTLKDNSFNPAQALYLCAIA